MRLGGLSWRLLATITLVVVLALAVSAWVFTAEIERLRSEELTRQLVAEARLLALALAADWPDADVRSISGMVRALHEEGTEVLLLTGRGNVLLNTSGRAELAAEVARRPEMQAALHDGRGTATLGGQPGATPIRAVALRVGTDANELGVLWLARPIWPLAQRTGSLVGVLIAVGLVTVVTVLGLGSLLVRRWSTLLRRMSRAADSLAAGDFTAQVEVHGSDEFALLARALNQMRRKLHTQLETIDRQRRSLATLLEQLHEGVIAADADGRVLLANPAATRLLNLPVSADNGAPDLVGRAVEQCLPQFPVQELLSVRPVALPAGGGPAEDLDAHGPGAPVEERQLRVPSGSGAVHVLARGSDLRLPDAPHAVGRLVVLTDVTALARALQMQTDFVANASHELRTPLASIRAAVETLLTLDPRRDGGEMGRFIGIIDRHSARLGALVSDLLDLSRLQAPGIPWPAEPLDLSALVQETGERFAEELQAHGLRWEVDLAALGEDAQIAANAHLLRLVLDNLVDNAIKFTPPGGIVRLVGRREEGQTVLEVADTGCGIPDEEQARVFERFYQVERARSGPQRGTGLGLAIVRDAAAALGATVRLESQVERGTRVTVRLP